VTGYSEQGIEHLYSIKDAEFVDQLSVLLAYEEGLSSMELVSYLIVEPQLVLPLSYLYCT
jgi:hypothetical protein